MPRHSPYPVVLSPEERHVLTARAAQYTRPCFEVQRAQMILLAAAGLAQRGNRRPRADAPRGRLALAETLSR